MKTSVLILCTGNSCRSQMAEGFLRSFDLDLEVYSAGTEPSGTVHPMAIKAMAEEGIDISGARPKSVDGFLSRPFDFVVTVCDGARESCPVFTGKVGKRLHIGFEDPAMASGTEAEVLKVFRSVRDLIKEGFGEFYRNDIKGDPHE
ncbi:arsenate reductase ArsC [Pelodictyon luteolum]|uniref:Protein tyrosine phosphatase n=1 Tax=Chlorobium luteolum (strain DSM 273 / BCRC 81028 / 2530) TaxID=319225 RepID=Q3B274_CHLL3|nr:arsenate reductase ArsC [Pelodictyon luteolum]ABB24557.1 protein tyrosine phosphatase [Pelodictyon luteolum DSM 273]